MVTDRQESPRAQNIFFLANFKGKEGKRVCANGVSLAKTIYLQMCCLAAPWSMCYVEVTAICDSVWREWEVVYPSEGIQILSTILSWYFTHKSNKLVLFRTISDSQWHFQLSEILSLIDSRLVSKTLKEKKKKRKISKKVTSWVGVWLSGTGLA